MSAIPLRVFYGPTEDGDTACLPADKTVTVPLGEILPLLADAFQNRRTWLSDFEDDAVTLSADLYEVALAYQHHRRPSA